MNNCFPAKVIPFFVIVSLLVCTSSSVNAQYDIKQDIGTDSLTATDIHSPGKATLMSTVLPGSGQFYNKQYWKIPIIYGAFAGLFYLIDFNSVRYNTFKRAYIQRADGDSATIDNYIGQYSESNLFELQQFYRRNRDLSIAGVVLVYVLNIIDAHVFAHLYDFDVSEDLSMKVTPVINFMPDQSAYQGLSIRLTF